MNSNRILVWDAPTRIFHWLLVLCFAGAWLSSESDRWQQWHIAFGYTAGGLIGFRMIWGLMGTRYARFRSFVASPARAWSHLRNLFGVDHRTMPGHNPAGGLLMLALMGLVLGSVASGHLTHRKIIDLEDLHEGMATLALALVGLHVAAAVFMSWVDHDNLIRAMIDGRKAGTPEQAIRSPLNVLGLVLLLVAGWFFVQVLRGAFAWLAP